MAKRSPATLEIRRNSDGTTTYRVRWSERDRVALAAGKPRRPTYTFNTRELGDAKALAFAQRLQALVTANGGATPTHDQFIACGLGWKSSAEARPAPSPAPSPSRSHVTVADACWRYLTWKQGSVRPLSEGSLRKHQSTIRRYIEPTALGSANVADIRTGIQTDRQPPAPDTCLGWQAQLMRSPLLNVNTIADKRTFLSSVFTWACTENSGTPPLRIAPNPLRGMQIPRALGRRRREFLRNPTEVATCLRIAYRIDPQWAAMLLTMLVTGLRDCEASCLDPAAVDHSRNILHVRQHWGDAGDKRPGRKNGDEGEVPVPEWVMRRIIAPRAHNAGGLLLPNRSGSRWHSEQHDKNLKKLRTAMREEGMPRHLTTHSMRHSFSNWLKRPLGDEVLAAAMGHRRKTMTGNYIELTDEDMTEIRAAMSELVPESAWPDASAAAAATPTVLPSAAVSVRNLVMLPEFRAA
jgi:integrase